MAIKKRTTKKSLKLPRVKHTRGPARHASQLAGVAGRRKKEKKLKRLSGQRKKILPKKSKKFVKKKSLKPLVEEAVKEPGLREIWDLVTKGRNRGFITQTEAEGVFSRPENYLDLYEGFMDLLYPRRVLWIST